MLLYKSAIALFVIFLLFIIIPPTIISIDILALTVALILIITSKLNPKDIITKIDFELILYLIGIFIISGALEYTGLLYSIGEGISYIAGGSPLNQILIIIWFSAYLSSNIDNIPITKILIPAIGRMPLIPSIENVNQPFFSLALGANWGDNLTPMGDNILVANIAEKNKRPISMKQFFKLGFFTTNYQLLIVSLYFVIIYQFLIGMMILLIVFFIIFSLSMLLRLKLNKGKTSKIQNFVAKIRNFIIE